MLQSLVLEASSTHKIFSLSQFNQQNRSGTKSPAMKMKDSLLTSSSSQKITTNLLHASEDLHHVFQWLFNNSFQTLHSIKDHIFRMCTGLFFCKLPSTNLMDMRISRDNKLFSFAFQDLIATIENKYQQNTQDWSPPLKNSKGRGDPEVALNMLDAILKSSLERLKLMRESMSLAHSIGNYNYNMKAGYNQHVNTIRNLSLGGRLGAAMWLHNKMIHNNGVIPDVVTHNHLINGFCKVGAFEKAEWLIRQMSNQGPTPNCATYNTLMKGYCAFDDIEKAQDLLSTMSGDGGGNKVKPNNVTFNILVHALCKKGLTDEARVLLSKFSKLTDENRQKNLIASTILMDNYFKNGNTSLALTLWGDICKRSKKLDVVAYNVLVHGYYLSLDVIVVYKYVNEMLKIGFHPDNYTYNTLISGLCKVNRIDEACYLFYIVMSRMGVFPDMVSYNILIRELCNAGYVVKAHELLNCMLEKSMVPKPLVWNIIIHAYGKNGDKQKAFHVRDQMVTHGVSPNVFTYNALIHMFISSGEIFEAHLLMKEMLTVGPFPDTVTYNLLVGAESEYGHLYSAHEVYNDMLKRGYHPDVVTYTKLIKGYCMRGKVNEAERLFFTLCDSNLVIDHVPFQILIKKYFKMGDFSSTYRVYQKWVSMD